MPRSATGAASCAGSASPCRKVRACKNISATGGVNWDGSTLTFDDGSFSVDDNAADGLLAITAGAPPRIEGTLAFDRLVLDPYLLGANGRR